MDCQDILDFLVRKDDLRTLSWRRSPARPLDGGEIRVRIDRFAFTANNVTYALFGDRMGYWQFYPGPEGWGRPPVWGFATVDESTLPQVRPGQRFWGLWPMSSHAVMQPGRLTSSGFEDTSPWRAGNAAPYNRYLSIDGDPNFAPELEAGQAVLRPLIITSFLIADFIDDNDGFGADAVLVSSASSKTSLGLGYMLKSQASPPNVFGLTSARNADFARRTGYYDEVVTYDQVTSLPRRPTLFVDMAGGAKLRKAVHHHLADDLTYSCAVGGTHWEDPGRASGLPGPRPILFFAPGRTEKRYADWGPGGLECRFEAQWQLFLHSAAGWLEEVRFNGPDQVEALYRSVLEGESKPWMATVGSLAAVSSGRPSLTVSG